MNTSLTICMKFVDANFGMQPNDQCHPAVITGALARNISVCNPRSHHCLYFIRQYFLL